MYLFFTLESPDMIIFAFGKYSVYLYARPRQTFQINIDIFYNLGYDEETKKKKWQTVHKSARDGKNLTLLFLLSLSSFFLLVGQDALKTSWS